MDELVTCPLCSERFADGTEDAEFITWHGECARCMMEAGE